MSTEQRVARMLRAIIMKSQTSDAGPFNREEFFASQCGKFQGTLLAVAQDLESGTPLEAIRV
jgi:hypothetical protein